MSWAINDTYRITFSTKDAGAPADADSLPTGILRVNGSDTAVSVTVTDLGTGFYEASCSLSGRSNGDIFEVVITATINSVAFEQGLGPERIDATIASRSTFDPDNDDVAKVTLVATTTTNTDMRGTDGAYTGTPPTAAAIATAVWGATTRTLSAFGFSVTVGTNNDKTGYSLSTAGVAAIWNALVSGLTTASSIGKLLVDNINATISSRASGSSVTDLGTPLQASSYTAPLDAAGVRAAVGLASANLDTQLAAAKTATGFLTSDDLPTNFSSFAVDANGRVDVSKINGSAATLVTTETLNVTDGNVHAVNEDGEKIATDAALTTLQTTATAASTAATAAKTAAEANQTEIAKIPRSGQTYRYTNATSGGDDEGETEDVTIGEVP